MPRDGSNIYHRPPGTDAVTDTTIESTKYNSNVADVEQDLNLPRPIVAGGTGANNATDAMTSLQGDKAYQVVTNYDSYPFLSGSFYSAAGATSAPTGNAFIGHCYTSDPAVVPPAVSASANMFIEARDVTTGLKYLRQKTANVWGTWAQQAGSTAVLDAAYVNVAGDTMTGNLAIGAANPSMYLHKAVSGQSNSFYGTLNGSPRWEIRFGDATPEGGGNVGSNFDVARYNDAGALIDLPLSITRSNGAVTLTNLSVVGGGVTCAQTPTTGTYLFGATGTKYLSYDGTNFNFAGGDVLVPVSNQVRAGAFTAHATATTGNYYFGDSGTKQLNYDGTQFNLTGGSLNCSSNIQTPAGGFVLWGTQVAITSDGTNMLLRAAGSITCQTLGGTDNLIKASGRACRGGISGSNTGNSFNIAHTTGQQVWIDTTNVGTIAYTSDYRIKKDVIDLPGMWDTVKALRPIKYTQAQFSPPSHVAYMTEQKTKDAPQVGPLFEADNIERWGFIAHELQATLTPSAATGVKDAPDTIQSPNPFTLIAALTKALQEAMARIEALEGK